MTARAWLLLAFLSLLWGGSFFTIKIAVTAITPLTLMTVRVALAAACLYAVMIATGGRLAITRRTILDYVVMGALNAVLPFSLITWGEQHIPSGLAAILNAFTPVSTILIAHFLTADDRLTSLRTLGVAFGFAGVIVLIGAGLMTGLGDNLSSELACLGATVSYGVSSLWSRRLKGRPPLVNACGQFLGAAVIAIPLDLLIDHPWQLALPAPAPMLAMLFLAIMSTALAYVVFFRIITLAGPSNVQFVTFLIPVSSVLLGTIFLGERLEARHYGGMALIALGLSAIDGRLWRLRKPAP